MKPEEINVMKRKSDNDFVRGYVCACCCMLNSYGSESEVAEALRCIGFSKLNLRIIDEADRQTLKEWKFIPRKQSANGLKRKERENE